MKVIVHFMFPNITDPNSTAADDIAQHITEQTTRWVEKFDAYAVWVDDVVAHNPGELGGDNEQ